MGCKNAEDADAERHAYKGDHHLASILTNVVLISTSMPPALSRGVFEHILEASIVRFGCTGDEFM